MNTAGRGSDVETLSHLVGDRVLVMHAPDAAGQDARLSGSDVDMFVERIDLRWPLRLPPEWRLTQVLRYDFRAWYWVLEHAGDFLALDTTDDPVGLGRDTVRTAELLDAAGASDPSAFRGAYLAIKRVRKLDARASEWDRIGRIAAADEPAFDAALRLEVGDRIAASLHPWALRGAPPPDDVAGRINRLRYVRRFGTPARVVRALDLAARRYLERFAHPSGYVVVVVGPDGSGKSTLAAAIPDVCGAMFKRLVHLHWRPGLLPRPGSLVRRAASDPSRPHDREPFGRAVSLVLLGYYWADFVLGDWTTLLHARIRSSLVVIERGWWDIAVDPRRYRLDVPPGAVRALGRLLRRPDLTVVLSAPAPVLRERKAELDEGELERQMAAWRETVPARVERLAVDVSAPVDDAVAHVREGVVSRMETRAARRLDAGWLAVAGRWWIPRASARAARTAFELYQPPTPARRVVWEAARAAAGLGVFRLLPRGDAPPRAVRTAVAPYVPPRGTYAVARGSHPGRFVASVLDGAGRPTGIVKIATCDGDAAVLNTEADAIERIAGRLASPLAAPRLLARAERAIVLEPVRWKPRPAPWAIPDEVAFALGRLATVAGHGDCAPWNLLQTGDSWVLLDWERARLGPSGFDDLSHFFAISTALLERPTIEEVVDGFAHHVGSVGRAVLAFADGSGQDADQAIDGFRGFLERGGPPIGARTANERRGRSRLERLRGAVGP